MNVPPIAQLYELRVIELALRDTDRQCYAGLDKCIAKDSSLSIATLMPGGLNRSQEFDNRILHLPV
jgi:hypothetical protein